MDYLKMLKDISKLIENDFIFDMECKLISPVKKYTQKEAIEMADILSKVYSISHCIHCKACSVKYKKYI